MPVGFPAWGASPVVFYIDAEQPGSCRKGNGGCVTEKSLWPWLIPLAAFVASLVLLFVFLPGDPADWIAFFVNRETRPRLFLVLMILLPLVGFPISPFLLLVGVKFGTYWGLAVTAGVFAGHLIVSYVLTHSLLRPFLWKVLAKTRYELPEIHHHRRVPFSLIFMAVPGLPYAVKNYALAMLNVPFRIYLPIAWGANLLLAVPFVGLGHSIIANPKLAWVFVALLGLGYLLALKLRRRFRPESGKDD